MNLQDITTILFLLGIFTVGSILMDFEGSIEAFKSLKEFLNDVAKEINRI